MIEDDAEPTKRRKFRSASLKTGIYEFIPLPFLDDWMIGKERQKVVRAVLEERGFGYDPKVPATLANGGRSLMNRVGSMFKGLVTKPLKKLFRTVFFWLTARNAAANVMATYFLARFLQHPKLNPNAAYLEIDEARRLAKIFTEISKNLDLRAAGSAVQRVLGLIKRTSGERVASDQVERAIEEEAPGFVAEFDRLVAQRLA